MIANGLWVGEGISVDELYIGYLVYRIVKSREMLGKSEDGPETGIGDLAARRESSGGGREYKRLP